LAAFLFLSNLTFWVESACEKIPILNDDVVQFGNPDVNHVKRGDNPCKPQIGFGSERGLFM
jgi:hypothetical protein